MAGTWFNRERNEGEVDGRYTRDYNEYLRWGGQSLDQPGGGGGGGGSVTPFNFDWTRARSDAMEQLRPYYEQKLREAGGDVERAKRLIQEDYDKGLRRSQDDFSRGETQRTEDLTTSLREESLNSGQETRALTGNLNERGVLFGEMGKEQSGGPAPYSQFASAFGFEPLKEKQDMRKLAIERAIRRQGEVARTTSQREQEDLGTGRRRAIEEYDIQYPRTQRDLQEEQRNRAFNEVAPSRYQEELTRYRAVNRMPS